LKHIKGLDTLRAFAVIMVIITHWGPLFDESMPVARFIQTFFVPDGAFGVTLFFVLSGFLITSILLKARPGNGNQNRFVTVKNFFFRRVLRIFPIYYLLIGFLYLINFGDVRANIWYSATYTLNMLCYRTNAWNSISHVWTLAIEEQFYLLWPWLIIFTGKKYLKYVFWGAIITGVVSTYFVEVVWGHMDPFLVINCFDAFGIGGFYAWAMANDRIRPKFEKTVNWLALICWIIYFYWKVCFYTHNPPQNGIFIGKTVVSIICLWLVMQVTNNKSVILRKYLWENRFFNYVGKISYGIYLYHSPFIPLLSPAYKAFLDRLAVQLPAISGMLTSWAFLYWTQLVILLGICTVSYYVIEKPILDLKRFFKYKERDHEFSET